jgi:alpha-mannosidase
LGYATYDLRLNDAASASVATGLAITNNTIENEEYKLTVNTKGEVYSIVDKKQANKELLKAPSRMSLQSDKPGYWMSWELSWDDVNRTPVAYVDGIATISIAENGPLRAALKVTRSKNGSSYVQYIRLASGVSAGRIDFINEVDWQTRGTLLKVAFPLQASNPKATYDLSIGTIERGNRSSALYEVAGHQWADLTNADNAYGISILNDCKYGWDKENDNTLRLTLIHTPQEDSDRTFQKHQDLGLNKFTYSFFRHLGKWDESTQWEAAKLNQPLLAYETPKHTGSLGKSFEFVRLNTEKVAVKALKKAESSDEIVVRVYELVGENHNDVKIQFPATIVSAREVNGVEDAIGAAAFSGNELSFAITKYQPKTFAVTLAAAPAALTQPASSKVSLPYNVDVISSDSKINDGEFGSTGFTYPAELLQDELLADGITFAIGPRGDGELNAVQCQGQEINLPSVANGKKLYLLAASQNKDGSPTNFTVNGISTPVRVEYFGDFVGQWETNFSSRKYKKENTAFTATHRHNLEQKKNDSYSYLYMFKYLIPVDSNAQKLILPNDPDVIVFAVSLSNNENDDAKPASEVAALPEYTDLQSSVTPVPCASRIRPSSITSSGFTNEREKPEKAADDNAYTKWCDDSSSVKWIQYNFGKPVRICQWNVLHGGLEGDGKISADFRLLRYENGSWIDVDIVTANTNNKTVRTIEPVLTDRVRLRVTKGELSGNTARIYSFEVFGTDPETGIQEVKTQSSSVRNYPNPFSESTTFGYTAPGNTTEIRLTVSNVSGKVVDTRTYPITEPGGVELVWNNRSSASGLYLYTLSAWSQGKKIDQCSGKMIIKE